MPLNEIARLEKLQGAELNEAKKILATEATAILHGRKAADGAAETARRTFEEGAAAEGLPTIEIPRTEFPIGILTLAVKTGLTASNGEARKLIQNNGLKINDVAVSDPAINVNASDAASGAIKLSSGKKKHVLVKPV
jgi:tyrosyl-tRNA synthetase